MTFSIIFFLISFTNTRRELSIAASATSQRPLVRQLDGGGQNLTPPLAGRVQPNTQVGRGLIQIQTPESRRHGSDTPIADRRQAHYTFYTGPIPILTVGWSWERGDRGFVKRRERHDMPSGTVVNCKGADRPRFECFRSATGEIDMSEWPGCH